MSIGTEPHGSSRKPCPFLAIDALEKWGIGFHPLSPSPAPLPFTAYLWPGLHSRVASVAPGDSQLALVTLLLAL